MTSVPEYPADIQHVQEELHALLRERGKLSKSEICLLFGLDDDTYNAVRQALSSWRGIRAVGGQTGGLALDRRVGGHEESEVPLPLTPLQEAGVERLLTMLSSAQLRTLAEQRFVLELSVEGAAPRVSARRVAEILVLTHDRDLLADKAIREAIGKALGLKAPARWHSGGAAAAAFVRAASFPIEYAGIALRDKPEAIELVEPYGGLPPLMSFQQALKDMVRHVLEEHGGRAIASLPTGAGKTRTAVEAATEWFLRGARGEGSILIWLAHTTELCEQACECFHQVWTDSNADQPLRLIRKFGGLESSTDDLESSNLPTVIVTTAAALDGVAVLSNWMRADALRAASDPQRTPSQDRIEIFGLLEAGAVPSQQSAAFFGAAGLRLGALIIDEAHRAAAAGYRAILEWAKHRSRAPSVVGLTATPFRGVGADSPETKELSSLFGERLLEPHELGHDPRGRLQELRVLAKPAVEDVASGIKIRQLPDNPIRVDEAMRLWTDSRARRRIIVERIAALAALPEASILYFGPSVEDAHSVALLLRLRGVLAQGVDGTTRRDARRSLIEQFRDGRLTVLCNCELLTTGFDSPRVSHVVVGRPTTSQVLYEQMVGRGLRGPLFGGTEECLILDIIDGFMGPKPMLGLQEFRKHWKVQRLSLS